MISPLVSERLEELRRTLHATFELLAELPDGGALVAVTPLPDDDGEVLPAFCMRLEPLRSCDVEDRGAH